MVVSELGYIALLETAAVTTVSMTTLPYLGARPFLFLEPVTSHSMFPELGRKGNVIFFETGTSLAQFRGLNMDPRASVHKC